MLHLNIFVVSVLAWASLARGEELTYPSEASASTEITLTAEHVTIPYNNIVTRGYNGGVPGPTIRCKPGDTIDVTIVNDLLSENNIDCDTTGEEFCKAATTSFHTHGLHVSSWGVSDGATYPSDDVTTEVSPGASQRYQIQIPSYHMGGTHWYHPHTHHATAIQAGGGMLGMIIVEDPDDYFSTEYSSMEEKHLIFSGHNWETLEDIAENSQSGLLEDVATDLDTAGLATNVVFVNGQFQPTLTLESGNWYRFRNLFAAIEQDLIMSASGDATCTMKLLAKDGIYITDMPRDIDQIYMFPGGRSDVAVTCTCTTYPCTADFASTAARRRLQGRGGGGPAADDTYEGTVMTLNITQGTGTAASLPSYTVDRPCYLVDLQNVDIESGNSGELDLDGGDRRVTWNGEGLSMTHENFHSVGWDGWTPLTTFAVGSVYEMVVSGANAHPLHTHVNPYQITSLPDDSYYNDYVKVGDWHDTLMITELGGADTITVRQQTDAFTGKEVIHCHILEHEDEGMMNFLTISGTEGTTWSGAESVDSTCYRSSFSSSITQTTTTKTTTTASTTAAATTTAATAATTAAATTTTITTTTTPTTTTTTTTSTASTDNTTTTTTDSSEDSMSMTKQTVPILVSLLTYIVAFRH